jgi:cell division protein FtsW (lipid II flippase)
MLHDSSCRRIQDSSESFPIMKLFGVPLKTPALREAVFVALFTLVVCCVVVLTMKPHEGGALIAGTIGGLMAHTHGVSPRKQGLRGFAAMLVIYAAAGLVIGAAISLS